MGGMRSDVAFTLFLSEPESYDGGELMIDSAAGEDAIKLAPGALVAYPATSLHRCRGDARHATRRRWLDTQPCTRRGATRIVV